MNGGNSLTITQRTVAEKLAQNVLERAAINATPCARCNHPYKCHGTFKNEDGLGKCAYAVRYERLKAIWCRCNVFVDPVSSDTETNT